MATVTRIFDSHIEAMEAVSDLEAAGIASSDISIVSNNTENWHDGHRHGPLGARDGDGDNEAAEGAGKGAAAGGAVGAGVGVLAGLGMLAVPGLGPVVAAGWLASTAVGAAVGAAAGGAAGGLLGALKEAGHDDDEAHVYAEGVRRGGSLVSVRTHDADRGRVETILNNRRGFDALTRGRAYRDAGWSRFDPEAPPYSVEDVQRERLRYR